MMSQQQIYPGQPTSCLLVFGQMTACLRQRMLEIMSGWISRLIVIPDAPVSREAFIIAREKLQTFLMIHGRDPVPLFPVGHLNSRKPGTSRNIIRPASISNMAYLPKSVRMARSASRRRQQERMWKLPRMGLSWFTPRAICTYRQNKMK